MADFDLWGNEIPEPVETRGRPRHEPEELQRDQVMNLAGLGIPQDDIARFIRIDPVTLRDRYRDELDRGKIIATAKVSQNLFNIANGAGREAVTAAMFWLRCQAGWSEFTPRGAGAGESKTGGIGKKDAAQLAAETAGEGTGWAHLLH